MEISLHIHGCSKSTSVISPCQFRPIPHCPVHTLTSMRYRTQSVIVIWFLSLRISSKDIPDLISQIMYF